MLFASTDNVAGLPKYSSFATKPVICSFLMIHDREMLARLTSKPPLFDDLLVKELDSSSHIIRHLMHNDKLSRCLNVKRTSEREK